MVAPDGMWTLLTAGSILAGASLLWGITKDSGLFKHLLRVVWHKINPQDSKISSRGPPVSIENQNVEGSDTTIEIHYHYYDNNKNAPQSLPENGQEGSSEDK